MSARELTRVEVLSRVKAGTLSVGSAATLMAVSYRQAKRLARRYRAEGAKGLKHRSAGGASNHARPTAERERVLALVREKYSGPVDVRFGPTLAAEHLASEDGITVHHDTLRRWMLAAGLWSRARKRVAASRAAGAQGAFRRAGAARWQFPPVVRGARPARLLDEPGRRCDGPDARAARGRGNDLGGGRCAAPVDRGVRRAAGALYGLEECLCAGAECGGAGHGGRAPDAVWPHVRVVGDSDHRGELAAGEGPGRAQSRHPSGSPGEEIAAVGDRGRDGGECVSGDDVSARAQRAASRRRPASAEDFHRRTPSRTALDRVLQLEETRVLSNDWVIRYDTRYFQVARQSHQAPARSTVLVRENAGGAIEIRYRGRLMRWTRDSGAAAQTAAPAGPGAAAGGGRRSRPPRTERAIIRGAAATTQRPASGPSRRGAANDRGLWTLPAPWTRRTRPPRLAKRADAFRTAPTGRSSQGTFLFR